jgi:hypothetical protein
MDDIDPAVLGLEGRHCATKNDFRMSFFPEKAGVLYAR